ncbi:MAG TPA: hypothetical protein VGI87_03090 [Solirubrobacteraceae bacterium]
MLTRIVCALLGTALLVGCGSDQSRRPSTGQHARSALTTYLSRVEPVRLAVNRLLDGADPILAGYHEHRLSSVEASRRMAQLETRFAQSTVDIESISPTTSVLRALHAEYAHTFILEDSYLNALVQGLRERDLDRLPDTESTQREAIIAWRIGLEVLARRSGVRLPADLAIAGRGEIRPSPSGT